MMAKTVVVIPAFNEEKRIGEVLKAVKSKDFFVVVVDDGSRDRTSKFARLYADVVLRHPVNMGKGVALKTGIAEALRQKPDYIVTMDADGQHASEDIPRLLSCLKQADISIGSRVADSSMPLAFRIGNAFIRSAFKALFGAALGDTQSGFRTYTANAAKKLSWESQGYAVETEMLVSAVRKRLKIVEVPIKTVYLERYKGTTVLDGIKIFARMLLWRLRLWL